MRININKLVGVVMFVALLVFSGCTGENDTNDPKYIGSAPDPVTDYEIESLAGGALITFKMPVSTDLLYVKAEYVLATGQKREAKSSLYKNTLLVNGFDQAGEYDVALYAVAKGEVSSEATNIKVTALTPPYLATRESLIAAVTFGGLNITCNNTANAELSLIIVEKDSLGVWFDKHTHYFSSAEVDFTIRGYDTIPTDFAIIVKDRWGNLSDSLLYSGTPIFEEEMDKTLWKKYDLPGDHSESHPQFSWPFEKMWDGKSVGGNNIMWHTGNTIPMPSSFTIDLGPKNKFSRFTLWQRDARGNAYNGNNVRLFELWCSNDPNPDGSLDSWDKIDTYEMIKPSGAPLGTVTDEDWTAAREGASFNIPPVVGSYRFVRINVLETWGRLASICIAELSFFGQSEKVE